MKLSTIFELLLIFLIIAFAASKVIESKNEIKWKKLLLRNTAAKELQKERQSTPNRYCSCSNLTCNCCRDFSLPVVPVSGPGCASLKYVQGDSMLVTMSFGNRVLQNVTISGKKPKPICMNLPGGISKFCGRVYGISREGDQIRACLGLELRALDDVEAALRVSCFKLGPNGLNVEPGKPVPTDEDDEDDDDDDGFELPGDDDDDEDDDDDDDDDDVFGLGDDDDSENTVESGESDYGGFSALSDEFLESFFESDSTDKKKKPAKVSTAHNAKPQQVVSGIKLASIPAATTNPNPGNHANPPRVITTKLVLSTPSKGINVKKVIESTTKYVPERASSFGELSTATARYTLSLANKVYVSPSQYKPTEKVRLSTVNQSNKSNIPSILQLSTEKVYTSSQQISTDKAIYLSTINQHTNNQTQQNDEQKDRETTAAESRPPPIVNLYVPTTQQFASTERVFMPGNLSTVPISSESTTGDFEVVTSTSMNINVVQSSAIEEVTVNDTKEPGKQATEVTPNSEYNEVDSDGKTTKNDILYESSSTPNTLPPTKINEVNIAHQVFTNSLPTKPTADHTKVNKQQNKIKDDSNDDEFKDVVNNAANVFGEIEGDISKENETASDDSDTTDILTDNDEDSDEGGIVLGGQNQQLASSENEQDENDDDNEAAAIEEDEDDDDDEFREFGNVSKKGTDMTTKAPSSPASQRSHFGREHKRMNLPPLFSQDPEISSFWSSGGHLYKIRTSATKQGQTAASFVPNINRLGKLNLFAPAETKADVNGVLEKVSSTSFPDIDSSFLHRFKLAKNRNQTDRIRRNHKYLRITEPAVSNDSTIRSS